MRMPATIKDVAREACVSISTVSKVLNDVPGISEATTLRVREIMRRLDYAPNSRAAGLARKSARCIAFLAKLDEFEPYTNPHLLGSVRKGLQPHAVGRDADGCGAGDALTGHRRHYHPRRRIDKARSPAPCHAQIPAHSDRPPERHTHKLGGY